MFRLLRPKIRKLTNSIVNRIGYSGFLFVLVVSLGLLSSVITAIIAALILVEIVSELKLSRSCEVKVVIIACFAIGLGAVLTPLGEPLATIAISKLKGEPHHADFFFLLRLLGKWVIPAVLGLGVLAIFWNKPEKDKPGLAQDKSETSGDVIFRAFKVYIFVLALVFLGTGFTPLVERYLVNMPAKLIYWVNIVSAVLDNATLTAAEISPDMSLKTIEFLLLGLLVAGGMLIPGNIPNIICANKLSIKSREWAMFGIPLGLILMIGMFIIITLAE
jgi:predicted cation transporter